MSYEVLNNEGLNYKAPAGSSGSYVEVVAGALNAMEREGWTLVAIEQASDPENADPLYIFHKDD